MGLPTPRRLMPAASASGLPALIHGEHMAGLLALQDQTGGGSPHIRVAVLDGPVDYGHACFRGARLMALHGQVVSTTPGAAARHGTHIASLIFGQAPTEVRGVAPGCTGLIIPIFREQSDGTVAPCTQQSLARAIRTALKHGAHVINISGGELLHASTPHPSLLEAIDACIKQNVVVVAAAGNDGCACPHLPAALRSVLAVGATQRDGTPLATSNWGGTYDHQGLLAPGEDVLGAAPGGGTVRLSGTSVATPLVSGVLALLLSLQLARGRQPDPMAVRDLLLRFAIACDPRLVAECHRHLAGALHIPPVVQLILQGETDMTETDDLAPQVLANTSAEGVLPEQLHPAQIEVQPPAEASNPQQDGPTRPRLAALLTAGPRESGLAPQGISPQACACGGDPGAGRKVYALGVLGYDFGSEAQRDAIAQAMPPNANRPEIPEHLLAYLDDNPHEAQSLIWTINLDATPLYAVAPTGPYADRVYTRLREYLQALISQEGEIVSIPGQVTSSVRLRSGQNVPLLEPSLGGMFCWSTNQVVEQVLGTRPTEPERRNNHDKRAQGLRNYLNRIYYDLRNMGATPEHRALNFSATNAFQAAQVISMATDADTPVELSTISVERSPICRFDSECYDVQLRFFTPSNVNVADRVFRFTVDVSGVTPVSIGTMRAWSAR